MANSLVDLYRQSLAQQGLTDDASDYELTHQLGQVAEQQNRQLFDAFPDFAKEYTDIREANAPSLGREAGNAFVQGMRGLGSTTLGGVAAVTGSDYLRQKARELDQPNPDAAPTIGTLEDIAPGQSTLGKVFSKDTLRYGLAKAGGAVPALGEGIALSAAGAALGSVVEPGAGTIAGGVEGAAEGVLGRGLIRDAIRRLIAGGSEGILKGATEDSVSTALLNGDTQMADLVTRQAKALAARRGGEAVNAVNAYLQSAGQIQNETDDRGLALGLGALAALPNTALPHIVLNRLFPDVAGSAAKEAGSTYLRRMGLEALKTTGIGATAGGFQEAVNIVARNLKENRDPLDFSDDDLRRLRESSIAGGIGGALIAPIAAYQPASDIPTVDQAKAARQGLSLTPTEVQAEVPVQPGDLARQVARMSDDQRQARLDELNQRPVLSPVEQQEKLILQSFVEPPTDAQVAINDQVGVTSPTGAEATALAEQMKRDQRTADLTSAFEPPTEPTVAPEAEAYNDLLPPETQAQPPPKDYQYTIQQAQEHPTAPGRQIPGYIQIDELQNGENTRSTNLEALKQEGVNLPEPPSWLPSGRYTLEQIQQAVESGAPPETAVTPIAAAETTLVHPEVAPEQAQGIDPSPPAAVADIPVQQALPAQPPENPSFNFGPVVEGSDSVDFRTDPKLANLTPEQLAKGVPALIKNIFSPEGSRSKTRAAIALEAPDGHVVKAGLTLPQKITDTEGNKLTDRNTKLVALQNFAAATREGGAHSKVIREGGGSPALLSEVIKAGYKPIAYISFDAEPGQIFQTFPDQKSFDAAWAATEKSTGKGGGMAISAGRGVQAAVDQSAARTRLQEVETRIDQLINRLGTEKDPVTREQMMNEYRDLSQRQRELFAVEQSQTGTDDLPAYRQAEAGGLAKKAEQFQIALSRLAAAGTHVDLFAKEILRQQTENPQAEGVTYSPWHIALGLDDIQNATTSHMVTLFHEATHALFRQMPADQQQVVIKAAENLLGELRTKGLAAAEKTGVPLSRAVNAEDQLAETLGQRLAAQGIPDAPSVAQALVRWVKDLYYRVAMAFQASFGGQPDDQLALNWVENQLRRQMGGDFEYSLANLAERFLPEAMARRVQRFEVQGGTPGGVTEFTDPFTLEQSQPAVTPSTIDGLKWNLQFRTEADQPQEGEAPPIPGDEARARIQAAAINEEARALAQIHQDLAPDMPFQNFWKIAGRGDLPQARLQAIEEALQGASTATIAGDRMSETMNKQAQLGARILLEKIQHQQLRRASTLKEQSDRAADRLVELSQQTAVLEQNLRDANAHELTMRDKLKTMIRLTVRGIRRGMDLSAQASPLAEAIREVANLGGDDPIPEQYQRFMERAQHEGVSLFNHLEAVANMDLDLSGMSIREIVKAVRDRADDNPTLHSLTQDYPMFSAIVALARDNAEQMDQIQLGRVKDTVQFLNIKKELDAVRSANESQLQAMLANADAMAQKRGLAQRIRNRYLERRAELRRTQAVIQKAATQGEILREAQAKLQPYIDDLQTATGAFSDWKPVAGRQWTAMQLQSDGSWKPETRTLQFNPDGSAVDAKTVAHDLVQNAQWLSQNQDKKGQAGFERIKQQTYELRMLDLQQQYPAQWRSLLDRMLQPLGDEAMAAGHSSGFRIKQMLIHWQSVLKNNWKNNLEPEAHWWTKAWNDTLAASGISDHGIFREQVYNPVRYLIESEPGLTQDQALRMAVKAARDRLPGQPTEKFNETFRNLMLLTKRTNDAVMTIAEKNNIFVSDPRLGGALRKAVPQGWLTGMRSIKGETVQTLTHDMEKAGWKLEYVEDKKPNGQPVKKIVRATTFDSLTPEIAADPAALGQALAQYFTPGIVQRWFEPFMNKPGAPLFSWDGRAISQLDVQQAWQDAAGNVVQFIDGLGQRIGLKPGEDGADPAPAFRVGMLKQIDRLFGMEAKMGYEAAQTRNLFDPQGPRPHVMMDSRMNELIPPEHLDYQMFDPTSTRTLLGVLGFHSAFGRNGETMVATLNELKSTLSLRKAQFEGLRGTSKKSRLIDAESKGLNYKELERAAKNYDDVVGLQQKLEHLFGFSNQAGPLGEVRAGLELLRTITGQVVNNPKTGLLNLVSLTDRPVVQRSLGPSAIRASLTAGGELGKNVFGSLLESMGLHLMRASTYAKEIGEVEGRAFQRLPWAVALSDIGKEGNEQSSFQDRYLIKPLRKFGSFQRKGVSLPGESREFARANVVPGVGGIIHFLSQESGVANSVGNIQQFELVIKRAVDFFAAHPEAANDPNYRLSSKDLKMNGRTFFSDEGVFDYYRRKTVEYRVGNLEQIAREAMARQAQGDRLLTSDQVLAVSMMSANELNLEASVNTRLGAVSQNPILKYGMPLLGWPLEKMNSINRAMKTADGQFSAIQMLKTLGTMAMWNLPIGIAFTLAMDKYDEKLLKKKSNMSAVDWQAAVPFVGPAWAMAGGDHSMKDNFVAMLERSAKAGNIYGLGSDLAAQIISPQLDPQAGQRTVSLDQRVLVMSQFLAVQQAITNFINQGNVATYASVEKPIIQAIGGNGVLHAVDLMNAALGMDNQEARMVQRTNVGAWLRSAGREVGMELRGGGSASSSPTPVSVWVREMQLASLANDRMDFMDAYQKALAASREEAPDQDPAKKVLASWGSRNPIDVFRNKPTDTDMMKLYSVMDDEGQRAVREALNLYNSYTELIAPSATQKYFNRMTAHQKPPTAIQLRRQAANIYSR